MENPSVIRDGFTLRDLFAGMAIGNFLAEAICASPDGDFSALDVAKYSYDLADALLAERQKREGV